MKALWLALVFLGCAGALAALEKASAKVAGQRTTSNLSEISTRPLVIYAIRGRRDPFVPDLEATTDSAKANQNLSISELKLVGFMESRGNKVALFRHQHFGTTYSLKSGQLFSPEELPLPGVSGQLESKGDVTLVQGERRVVFSSFKSRR